MVVIGHLPHLARLEDLKQLHHRFKEMGIREAVSQDKLPSFALQSSANGLV